MTTNINQPTHLTETQCTAQAGQLASLLTSCGIRVKQDNELLSVAGATVLVGFFHDSVQVSFPDIWTDCDLQDRPVLHIEHPYTVAALATVVMGVLKAVRS